MASSETTDDVLFDARTLRLIVGALAFAFPTVVIALTGKVTTSISASYHEVETRDVFVGFLFIIGALLISYKGHLQGEAENETTTLWERFISFRWLNRYQEDVISTIGGVAAIFTALFPTNCNTCPVDTTAKVHLTGAFILFSTIVYFCLIAFPRSLNKKLLGGDEDAAQFKKQFLKHINTIMGRRSGDKVGLLSRFWYFLTLEIQVFLAVTIGGWEQSNLKKTRGGPAVLPSEHVKRVRRGLVYLVCGGLIALDLIIFIILFLAVPDVVAQTIITYVVEAIALGFFGVAWITASKQRYIAQIQEWLGSFGKDTPPARAAKK